MPADRKSAPRRGAAGAAEPRTAPAPQDSADSADAADAVDAADADAAAGEESAPLNRAERRAERRGKRASNPQVPGRGKVTGRSGPVQGPRMWSNRRGGT